MGPGVGRLLRSSDPNPRVLLEVLWNPCGLIIRYNVDVSFTYICFKVSGGFWDFPSFSTMFREKTHVLWR